MKRVGSLCGTTCPCRLHGKGMWTSAISLYMGVGGGMMVGGGGAQRLSGYAVMNVWI